MDTKRCSKCGRKNIAVSRFCEKCGSPFAVPEEPTESQAETAAGGVAEESRHPPADTVQQLGASGCAPLGLWQPFAGQGQRGRHVSWLLPNLADRAEVLRAIVSERFLQRGIPGAHITNRSLMTRGAIVERRPYCLVQKGNTTVGLLIARFGHDLYISQVTYVKRAISPLRVILLLLLLLFQCLVGSGFLDASSNVNVDASNIFNTLGDVVRNPGGILCLGPLAILDFLILTAIFFHMVYKTLTERDPFAILRSSINEFQQDDAIALEKAVEETVRQALDAVGIDGNLMPPAAEYGVRRRVI